MGAVRLYDLISPQKQRRLAPNPNYHPKLALSPQHTARTHPKPIRYHTHTHVLLCYATLLWISKLLSIDISSLFSSDCGSLNPVTLHRGEPFTPFSSNSSLSFVVNLSVFQADGDPCDSEAVTEVIVKYSQTKQGGYWTTWGYEGIVGTREQKGPRGWGQYSLHLCPLMPLAPNPSHQYPPGPQPP